MKMLASLALVTLFSVNAYASTDTAFKADSLLPAELQVKVLEAVKSKCLNSLYGFSEDQTLVKEAAADQGKSDSFYRTFLRANYLFDGTHPVGVDIVVESAQYAGADSEVLSVKSFSEGICQ